MKKILFTGSFCSGKSTIANLLAEKLPNSILIPEVTREVLKLYGKVDWSIPELRDYILIKQLIEEEKAIQSDSEYVIIDSGIISFLAHDIVLIGKQPRREFILEYFNHHSYDFIFVCDHRDIQIFDDGERYTDKIIQDKIFQAVINSLCLSSLRYRLLGGTTEKRLDTILNIIGT